MKLSRAVWLAAVYTAAVTSAHSQSPRTIVYGFTPGADAVQVVDPKPRVDLGESGATEELFHRVAVVRQQSSGRIIVANRFAPELRVFDSNGRFLKTIGRKGQGPGEFQDVDDVVVRRGDSLVVLDRMQRRFTFFDPDGAVVSTLPLQPPFATSPYNVTVNGLDDGTLLIGYGLVTSIKPTPQPVSVPIIVGRYATSGSRVDSVGSFFSGENFLQAAPPTMGGFAFWDRAFGRKGSIVSYGDSFFAGDASAMEVKRFSAKGALLETHRIDATPRPVTPAAIDLYRTRTTRPQSADLDKRRVDEMPYPARFPAYARFLVDERGRIWLEEYQYPPTGNRWIVMDPRTQRAQSVRLPNAFVPYQISATEMLGVWRDADGVEHVRVYRFLP